MFIISDNHISDATTYIACPISVINIYQLDSWLSPSKEFYIYLIHISSTLTIHQNLVESSLKIPTPRLHHRSFHAECLDDWSQVRVPLSSIFALITIICILIHILLLHIAFISSLLHEHGDMSF